MVKSLIKQPLFVIGFLFVVGFIAASFYYQVAYHNKIPQSNLFYDENGKLIGAPPISPALYPPFGTDRSGYSMGIKILIGAKWTLGGAILIAFIRMLLAFFLGIIYGNYFYRYKRVLTAFVDGIAVIPLTLFAYIVLKIVLEMDSFTSTFVYPLWQRTLFEGMFISVIAVPVVAVLIGNEIGEMFKKEYIDSAKILGGSRWHIFWHHAMPHIMPKLFVTFVQQVIQVMVILGHLGLLGLFFGGTMIFHMGPIISSTQEWAGLIGENVKSINIYPWLVAGPIVVFTLGIMAFNFMLVGIQRAMKANKIEKIKRGLPTQNQIELAPGAAEPFAFISELKATAK